LIIKKREKKRVDNVLLGCTPNSPGTQTAKRKRGRNFVDDVVRDQKGKRREKREEALTTTIREKCGNSGATSQKKEERRETEGKISCFYQLSYGRLSAASALFRSYRGKERSVCQRIVWFGQGKKELIVASSVVGRRLMGGGVPINGSCS